MIPLLLPLLLASLGTTRSFSSSVPPSSPPGPYCEFITIKESLPCLSITPQLQRSALCDTGYGLISNLAATDAGFPCEDSPLLGWMIHIETHTRIHTHTGLTEVQLCSWWEHRSWDQSEDIRFPVHSKISGRGSEEYGLVHRRYHWWGQITQSGHSAIVAGLSLHSKTQLKKN